MLDEERDRKAEEEKSAEEREDVEDLEAMDKEAAEVEGGALIKDRQQP